MLSQLDNIIFPDRCEVLEVAPQRYVYPIYKNGYSSISASGFRTLEMTELPALDTVEIYVREPIERFFSGLSSYIEYNKHLDKDTLLFIAGHHLFINRHLASQFHWLVNLRRFTQAKIKINSVDDLRTITNLHINKNKNKVHYDLIHFPKVAFYMQLDKVLTETFLGQTVEFSDIVAAIKKYHPAVYQEIVQRSISLCNVLG
jgi:hypothetical protein